MRIVILATAAEGKSTLAAIVAQALKAQGIPVDVQDGNLERGDAFALLSEPERLTRNTQSIAGRLTAMQSAVLIETVSTLKEPYANANRLDRTQTAVPANVGRTNDQR